MVNCGSAVLRVCYNLVGDANLLFVVDDISAGDQDLRSRYIGDGCRNGRRGQGGRAWIRMICVDTIIGLHYMYLVIYHPLVVALGVRRLHRCQLPAK